MQDFIDAQIATEQMTLLQAKQVIDNLNEKEKRLRQELTIISDYRRRIVERCKGFEKIEERKDILKRLHEGNIIIFKDKLDQLPDEVVCEKFYVNCTFSGRHCVDGDYHVIEESKVVYTESLHVDFDCLDNLSDPRTYTPVMQHLRSVGFAESLSEETVLETYEYDADDIESGTFSGKEILWVYYDKVDESETSSPEKKRKL